jgi:hypothetical protein
MSPLERLLAAGTRRASRALETTIVVGLGYREEAQMI